MAASGPVGERSSPPLATCEQRHSGVVAAVCLSMVHAA